MPVAVHGNFDHLETVTRVMGLCRLPGTVCERVGERWRDGAGNLLILGYPVIPMHAPVLASTGGRCGRFSTIEKR
jgi:hypothetical protein